MVYGPIINGRKRNKMWKLFCVRATDQAARPPDRPSVCAVPGSFIYYDGGMKAAEVAHKNVT